MAVNPAELVEDPQTTTFVDTHPVAAAVVVADPVTTSVVIPDQEATSTLTSVPVATIAATPAVERAVPVPVVTVPVPVMVVSGSDGGYGARVAAARVRRRRGGTTGSQKPGRRDDGRSDRDHNPTHSPACHDSFSLLTPWCEWEASLAFACPQTLETVARAC